MRRDSLLVRQLLRSARHEMPKGTRGKRINAVVRRNAGIAPLVEHRAARGRINWRGSVAWRRLGLQMRRRWCRVVYFTVVIGVTASATLAQSDLNFSGAL